MMMESVFWFRLGLSFVVGGLWVLFSTTAAERFGSKVGGLIGGLPSTAAAALLFIGLTQSPEAASRATTIMPLAQGLNGLFLIAFSVLIRRGLFIGVAGSLLVWAAYASLLVGIGVPSFRVSVGGWLVLLAGCTLAVERWMAIPSRGRAGVSHSPIQILARALFGGLVIALAVFMGRVGGPACGGVFATFPAMFLSTLVVTYRSGGAEFSRAVAKSLMVSGLFNVAMYAVAVRYLYLWTGLAYGTLASVFLSLLSGYITYRFLKKRMA